MKVCPNCGHKLEVVKENPPDIAYWFDGKGKYLVKTKEEIAYRDLVLACMDLFSLALKGGNDIGLMKWTQESDEENEPK